MNTNLNQLLKDLEIGPAYVKILICLLGCTFMLYPTFFHFTCFFRELPVYGTFLNGNIIYTESLSAHGLIVMGNEGKGVSLEVEKLINNKLYIPNYPQERETSESLNVAIATAVVCSEFRRRLLP
jgi:hypothetical protein